MHLPLGGKLIDDLIFIRMMHFSSMLLIGWNLSPNHVIVEEIQNQMLLCHMFDLRC